MSIVLNGTTGITNDSGYTGDGVSFADSTPANTLVTTSGGNVGIGTSSPATKLDVAGPASVTSFTGTTRLGVTVRGSSSTNDYSGIDIIGGNLTTPVARIASLTTGGGSTLSFGTSNSYGSGITNTAMTIDSSGNLLVGTTSTDPIANGLSGIAFSPSTSYSQLISKANGTAMAVGRSGTGTGLIDFYFKGGSTVLTGSITTNGTTTAYNTSSDYRLKENVQPMAGALAKVAALKPCTYTWKSDGSAGEGFIAHELQEVVPECVTGQKDAVDADGNPQYQGIDTSFLVATLTAAIQEQQALIESLTARVVALEGQA